MRRELLIKLPSLPTETTFINDQRNYEIHRNNMNARFMHINDIEVDIDRLIRELDSCLTHSLCKKIKTRLRCAQTLAEYFSTLLKYGQENAALIHGRPMKTIAERDYMILFFELNHMMAAISCMSIVVEEAEETLNTRKDEYISILAASITPAVQCFTEGVISDLQAALNKSQLSNETFRQITAEHSHILADKFYGEENGIVAQQLRGLQGHYIELMVKNEQMSAQVASSSSLTFFAPEPPTQDENETNSAGAYVKGVNA